MSIENVSNAESDDPSQFSPAVVATTCGLISAVCYTGANICLRSVSDLDPVWVSCMKAMPMLAATAPLLLPQIIRSESLFPSRRVLWIIVLVSVIGQIIGNIFFQTALGLIGLALNVPITLGSMIVTGAFLGYWFLGDRFTPRMLLAGTVLIAAICVLSFGAGGPPVAHSTDVPLATATQGNVDAAVFSSAFGLGRTVLGILASCAAGLAYCSLSIGIRYATGQGARISSIMGVVAVVGVIGLGGAVLAINGTDSIRTPTLGQNVAMFFGGVFNYVAFLALIKALRVATVFFVNALNVSQIAMAATAGILLFDEPLTWSLGLGILLTATGLMLMKS